MTAPEPIHHVPEEDLVEYVAGTCSVSAALAVACHLSLCAACAGRRGALEAVGGASLEAAAPQPTARGALERLLALTEGAAPDPGVTPDERAAEALLASLGVPRAVLPYLDARAAASGWRRLVPGMTRIDLRVGPPGTVARLVTLQPGLEIPLHDHGGPEYTVIFTGALEDDQGRFARGDISLREAGERHVQHVDARQPCVALVVNEGPLLPLTWKGRALKLLSGG